MSKVAYIILYILVSIIMLVISTAVPIIVRAYFKYKKQSAIDRANQREMILNMARGDLLYLYNYAKDKGYIEYFHKECFINIWKQYHALGGDSYIDDLKEKFMKYEVRDYRQINGGK